MNIILCPVDFSACSNNAAIYAAAIAAEFHSRLILFNAYEKPIRFRSASSFIDKSGKTPKDIAKEKIGLLKESLERKYNKLTVETLLTEGAGNEKILSTASSETVDVIVMGATGKSKLKQLVMGSTASHVIGKAECPVLCIPKDATYDGIKKIAFATDMNEENINAALSIVTFAKHFNAEIVFVFVDDRHLMHSNEEIVKMTAKIRKSIRYTKLSGYISNNVNVTKGLQYFLKKNPADLLVMFTHEKRFTGTLLNQSITQAMSHESSIPLLSLNRLHSTILLNE
jgi:nucleotide-binding universal stress UspA family protein